MLTQRMSPQVACPLTCRVVSSSRPLQYPDLQLLRESSPWDCVIINGVPEVPTAAESSERPRPEANACGHSPTTSQESSLGLPAEPRISPSDVHQTEAGDVAAKSMLILGLRGQDHDLERHAPVSHATCSSVTCSLLLCHMLHSRLSHVICCCVTCYMLLCHMLFAPVAHVTCSSVTCYLLLCHMLHAHQSHVICSCVTGCVSLCHHAFLRAFMPCPTAHPFESVGTAC